MEVKRMQKLMYLQVKKNQQIVKIFDERESKDLEEYDKLSK